MKYKTGVICGAFDLIHPGYIYMFEEAKEICKHLTVMLHIDPSFEREGKLKPVIPLVDRIHILSAIKYVDQIIAYRTEKDLEDRLAWGTDFGFEVRFLGDDYIGKNYTGDKSIPVHFLSRHHGWSNTKLIELIVKRGLPDATATKDV